jgi:hypothetical protein
LGANVQVSGQNVPTFRVIYQYSVARFSLSLLESDRSRESCDCSMVGKS